MHEAHFDSLRNEIRPANKERGFLQLQVLVLLRLQYLENLVNIIFFSEANMRDDPKEIIRQVFYFYPVLRNPLPETVH